MDGKKLKDTREDSASGGLGKVSSHGGEAVKVSKPNEVPAAATTMLKAESAVVGGRYMKLGLRFTG